MLKVAAGKVSRQKAVLIGEAKVASSILILHWIRKPADGCLDAWSRVCRLFSSCGNDSGLEYRGYLYTPGHYLQKCHVKGMR